MGAGTVIALSKWCLGGLERSEPQLCVLHYVSAQSHVSKEAQAKPDGCDWL